MSGCLNIRLYSIIAAPQIGRCSVGLEEEMTLNSNQMLTRIGKLQQTRQYADEVESLRITQKIARLLKQEKEAHNLGPAAR